MHWGERLYQYKDGSLTPLGRIHYGVGQARVRRAEQVSEKARVKAETESQREKRRYQNDDGTLKLRGKLHYRTGDKYALLTDDELRQQTSRLQLQKNLEELKKQTDSGYRLKNKITSASEDIAVAGFKKAGEKLVNHYADTAVSKLLGTDKKEAEKVREFVEKYSQKTTKEILAENSKNKAFDEAYQRQFGTKPPKGFEYPDLTESEKEGLKKANNSSDNQNKQKSEKKSEPSEKKTKEQKSSESKKEEKSQKLSDSEISKIKSMAQKGDSVEEVAEKTNHSTATVEKYVNIKSPVMKELEDKPLARIHRVSLDEDEKKKKKG